MKEYIHNKGPRAIHYGNIAAVSVILRGWIEDNFNALTVEDLRNTDDIINSIVDTEYRPEDQEILDMAYFLQANPSLAKALGFEF